MMDVFINEAGKAIVAVNKGLSKMEAYTEGNKHFKVKIDALKCEPAWLVGKNLLYFTDECGGKEVWAISKI